MNNKIKAIREEQGLTQRELAEKIGITVNWLSKLENKKRIPNVSLAIRIAAALGVKVDDIFFN